MKRGISPILFRWQQPIRYVVLGICVIFCLFSLGYGIDLTGNYQGSWSSYYGGSGGLSAWFSQSGSTLTGTATIKSSICGDIISLPLSGSVTLTHVTFNASYRCGDTPAQLYADGVFVGYDTINGGYTIYGSGYYDSGTYILTRPPTFFRLSVTKSGAGSGTVTSSPSGINCGTTCSATFYTAVVALTAVPSSGSSFAGWTGCPSASGNTCYVIGSDISVDALFTTSECLWTKTAAADPQNIAASGSFLYGDFGPSGIWMWNGTPENWTKIAAADPENIAASGSELYGDFGPSGIWMWNGTPENWTRIARADPENIAVSGSFLYGDFGPSGIWKWNGSLPEDWDRIAVADPQNIIASGSFLYGDFGSYGIWRWDGSIWTHITVSDPQTMASEAGVLYGDFGPSGIWGWNGIP